MYALLTEHSHKRGYRVIWALRQRIDTIQSNAELQHEHFVIAPFVPQLELLLHERVALFLTHCGAGGVSEALFSRTPMLLMPSVADQHMNAKRVEELGAGRLVQDRQALTDLTRLVDRVLLNETSRREHLAALDRAHRMIAFHGGVAEAADFVHFVAEFGTAHLRRTHVHGLDADAYKVPLPWFQSTLLDVYVIVAAVLATLTVAIKKCCSDFPCLQFLSSKKAKQE